MRPRTQLTSQINLQCVEWGVVRLVDARALREEPIVKPTLQALCRLFIWPLISLMLFIKQPLFRNLAVSASTGMRRCKESKVGWANHQTLQCLNGGRKEFKKNQ